MGKFENAKIGDKVWDVLYGSWGEIIRIAKGTPYPLSVEFEFGQNTYSLDGMGYNWDKCPRLYWNEVKLPSDEEDRKPFDLVKFLKENFELKKFKKGEKNFSIYYYHGLEVCDIQHYKNIENIGFVYLTKKNTGNTIGDIKNKLNDQQIKPDELKQAFKELGWL